MREPAPERPSPVDEEIVIACADLVGRTGARNFQIGYLHDDVPAEEAAWYAHAQLRGARLTAENHRSPTDAAQALAERLLKGAKCKCGRLVATSADGAFAFFKSRTVDGKRWDAKDSAKAGQCRWRRIGPRWTPGCETEEDDRG
jgi:hypothetical protein